MNLSSKIFIGFFACIACLLGITLYVVRDQTERHEVARIEEALALVQLEFQDRLERHQKGILKLVQTITMDQKFRAFLSQIKDNYYSFTEEIALDTGGDIVFMVDDSPRLGGIYPASQETQTWFKKHLQTFRVADVLDGGKASFRVISLDNELFSTVNVPLKEALSDDYAIGVIVVCKRIDEAWIKWLFGQTLESFDVHVLFFSEDAPVAGNIPVEEASRLVKSLKGKEGRTGSYLFSEERYLARREVFDDSGPGVLAGYVLSSNLDRALRPFRVLQHVILLTGVVVLGAGMIFMFLLARQIVKPLRSLVVGTREVAKGNYDVRIPYQARDEVGQLSTAFNRMIEGLQEKERMRGSLSEYERQVHEQVAELERMSRLKRFFSPQLAELIVSRGGEDLLKSHRREVIVVFLDLRGFTAFADTVEPEEVMGVLGEYHCEMGQLIVKHQATLERFTGDGMMIFFNDPVPVPNPADQAVRMAVAMREVVDRKLRAGWVKLGYDLGFSIGIASGYATLGMIGFEGRRDYSAIGSVTNLAARLCGEARAFQVLVSQATLHKVDDLVEAEFVGELTLKGFQRAISAYNIIRLRE